MALSLRRWRPRHLFLAWSGYWLALLLLALGRPMLAAWRLTRSPPGDGRISAELGSAGAHLSIVERGVAVWSGSASLLTLALWIVGPPLLLWLAWLAQQRRPRATDAGVQPVAEERNVPASAPSALRGADESALQEQRERRPTAPQVERDRDRGA
jgi:hypothetical protein